MTEHAPSTVQSGQILIISAASKTTRSPHYKQRNEIPHDGWLSEASGWKWPTGAGMWSQISVMASAALSVTWTHFAFLNPTASNESVKPELTNWFGFPSDEPLHETIPLYVGPNVITERNEMKKRNNQRCNKVPGRPVINRQHIEKWLWTVWF